MQLLSRAITQLSNGKPHQARFDREHRPERARVHPERARVRDGVAAPRPPYERISWGEQGQLTTPLDLYDTWHELSSANAGSVLQGQIDHLKQVRAQTAPVYRERIDRLIATAHDVTMQLEAVAAC